MFLFFWTHSPSVSLSRASVVGKRENSSKDGIRHWTVSFNSKWYVKQQLRRASIQTELIYFPCTIILLSTNCVMRDKNAVMFGNQRRSLIEENCKQQDMFILTRTLREKQLPIWYPDTNNGKFISFVKSFRFYCYFILFYLSMLLCSSIFFNLSFTSSFI